MCWLLTTDLALAIQQHRNIFFALLFFTDLRPLKLRNVDGAAEILSDLTILNTM
jgi:hypothetical protein